MNRKANDPGLDVHLLPIERELDCALHIPLHKSDHSWLFRGTAPPHFSSSFPHLQFPHVIPPMGPFPKQGIAALFPACIHLSGQTLP